MSNHPRLNLGIYLAALVALCDQMSKWVIVSVVMQPPHVVPVTSFLNLVLVRNRGMIFGLLSHFNPHVVRYVLLAFAAVILFLLGRWLWHTG